MSGDYTELHFATREAERDYLNAMYEVALERVVAAARRVAPLPIAWVGFDTRTRTAGVDIDALSALAGALSELDYEKRLITKRWPRRFPAP